MTTTQDIEKGNSKSDYKKMYEELLLKYNTLLTNVDDIGFQIQTFAKQNKIKTEK